MKYGQKTIKAPERRLGRRSGVFIVNFELISSVSIVDFEQVNVRWQSNVVAKLGVV